MSVVATSVCPELPDREASGQEEPVVSSDRLRTRPDDRAVTGLGEGIVDTRGTLLLAGQAVRDRRRAEAALLHTAATWADQHGDDGRTHDHDALIGDAIFGGSQMEAQLATLLLPQTRR